MKKLSVINPATEEIIAELNEDTKESLQKKFESLKTAQPGWQKTFTCRKNRDHKKIF